MVDIATTTGTISGVLGVLREVVGLAKKAGSHELNEKVADLQTRILEFQTQMIELTNENHELRKRASELDQAADIGKNLVYEESVYWLPKEKGRDGPYCQNCWDAQRKLNHLTPEATKGTFACGVCNGGFRTSEYKQVGPTMAIVSGPHGWMAR